jgi:glutaconate CoA-transferase subunit B
MTATYTSDEMMIVCGSRALDDHSRCFVGIGLPSTAANLARRLHAPDCVLVYESGCIGSKPTRLPLSIGDGELAETADAVVSVPEIFAYWLQAGRIDVGFLGAAQLDRYGNINSTVIGEYAHPRTRLPGAGGAPEIAASVGRVIVIVRQSSRTFVENCDFRTSVGFGDGPGSREALGLRGGGPDLVITDLGILPDKTATVVFGTHTVNNAGDVAGYCNLGDITTGLFADFYQENVPFIWTSHDGIQMLPLLDGLANATAWTLNDRQQVVGFAGNSEGDTHAVLWDRGTVRDLGTLPDDNSSHADGINNRGQIVGVSDLVEGDATTRSRPVLWEKGRAHALPLGDYPSGRATQINDKGQIIGFVTSAADPDDLFQALPALWDKGGLTVLAPLPGSYGSAWDINDKGQVVGFAGAADGTSHGFIWEKGVMRDPGTRGGSFTALWAVNNKGQAVGESTDADEVDHAILVENGVINDLNNMIRADLGWVLLFADGINERGQIAGTGLLNGEVRSFLLTPTQ